MQVLKFGGTSVANAENISKVIHLIREAVEKDRTIVVVSALGGITDMLIQTAASAAAGDETYKDKLAGDRTPPPRDRPVTAPDHPPVRCP